jgi:hypothetical protein
MSLRYTDRQTLCQKSFIHSKIKKKPLNKSNIGKFGWRSGMYAICMQMEYYKRLYEY